VDSLSRRRDFLALLSLAPSLGGESRAEAFDLAALERGRVLSAAERDATNNHGVCWMMQAAEFARFSGNAEMTTWRVDRFKTVLVPNHIAADGSFPRELARTKPYGYSLFVLDAITAVAQILDLWTFTLPDGRGYGQGRGLHVSLHPG